MPAAFRPSALRTEYRVEPLGIDTAAPRLSWELLPLATEARGLRQTAWQILVATARERLTPGDADLWVSDETDSNQTVHVEYAGRPLRSRLRCWWCVRCRDQEGRWSEWSEPASWTMGLLDPSEWEAKWIGAGESLEKSEPLRACANTLSDAWLRRTIELETRPTRATAFVASIGFHELHVNGVKASDAVLVPNVTDNSKRARYVAYEIGALLRTGRNVIGIWLGTGWSIFTKFVTADKPRAPIVLGQFDIETENGQVRRVITDAAWKTHPSPSMLVGAWDFKDFGGELYDANKEVPNWCDPSLDDEGWRAAVEYAPKIAVSADNAEANELAEELRPVAVQRLGDSYRFDLGRNFAGWIELKLRGEPGDRIEIQYSERAERAITHGMRSAYVIGPSREGVFRNRFNYGVGRWITVSGLRETPRLDDLRGWLVRPAYARAADFSCSLPLLNDIYETTRWTFENLTLGGYVVDCPHRERMGYGGDAYATTLTGLSAYRLGAFYTKWSEDWRDVQGRTPTWGMGIPAGQAGSDGHEEGNVPYTAPTYWGGGGPAWSGFCVYLPWEVYRRYGDERILRANFSTIERWLAFLETKTEGMLLERYGGLWDFLGDWMWPDAQDVNGDTRETLFFNNCYWIYNLATGAKIAGIVGRTDLQAAWERRANEVRAAVHAEFFNPSDASYVNGFQAYLAIALFAGVPPPELREAVWKRLEHEILVVRGGHIHAGITGGSVLFQLLMESGRDDLIFAMVNRTDPPGWGAMLRSGATTFWETWNARADSLLHSSFLFVGAWFLHGVLGLQMEADEAGFGRFVVRPGLVDRAGIERAEGYFDSVRGRISIAWRKRRGMFELELVVPPNTGATVYLPAGDLAELRESGREIENVEGVDTARKEGDRVALQVVSGRFHFSCPLDAPAAEETLRLQEKVR